MEARRTAACAVERIRTNRASWAHLWTLMLARMWSALHVLPYVLHLWLLTFVYLQFCPTCSWQVSESPVCRCCCCRHCGCCRRRVELKTVLTYMLHRVNNRQTVADSHYDDVSLQYSYYSFQTVQIFVFTLQGSFLYVSLTTVSLWSKINCTLYFLWRKPLRTLWKTSTSDCRHVC